MTNSVEPEINKIVIKNSLHSHKKSRPEAKTISVMDDIKNFFTTPGILVSLGALLALHLHVFPENTLRVFFDNLAKQNEFFILRAAILKIKNISMPFLNYIYDTNKFFYSFFLINTAYHTYKMKLEKKEKNTFKTKKPNESKEKNPLSSFFNLLSTMKEIFTMSSLRSVLGFLFPDAIIPNALFSLYTLNSINSLGDTTARHLDNICDWGKEKIWNTASFLSKCFYAQDTGQKKIPVKKAIQQADVKALTKKIDHVAPSENIAKKLPHHKESIPS